MSLLIFQTKLRFFRNGWMLFQTQWAVILAQNFHQNDVTYSRWCSYIYTNLSNVILRMICLEIVNLSFFNPQTKNVCQQKNFGLLDRYRLLKCCNVKRTQFPSRKKSKSKIVFAAHLVIPLFRGKAILVWSLKGF